MKKFTLKVLATAVLGHLATPSTAQIVAPASTPPPTTPSSDVPFAIGTNVLNFGLGFAGYWYSNGPSASPAFSISYEKGLVKLNQLTFGAGGYIGFQRATYGRLFGANNIVATVRGSLHYPALPNLDLYAGLGLGLRHTGLDGDAAYLVGEGITDVGGVAIVGVRYYFNEKIGAFAELGYDQTYFKAGLALKF